MSQSQFTLVQGPSTELDMFPHIIEFGLRKNQKIQLESFPIISSEYLRLFFIKDGRFEWVVKEQSTELFPGDTILILPGEEIGGKSGYYGIGAFFWLFIKLRSDSELDNWSGFSKKESRSILKVLKKNPTPVLKIESLRNTFSELSEEFFKKELGYATRVNQLLDEILLKLSRKSFSKRKLAPGVVPDTDFSQAFINLENLLRKNLSYHWTVEEMCSVIGLRTTSFNEKVKSLTGLAPLQYLINIRISEATKLLEKTDLTITDIALKTGFYSSQHFSTTFRKYTGNSPGDYRKQNN